MHFSYDIIPSEGTLEVTHGTHGRTLGKLRYPNEYRRQLVDAGYKNAHITIRDISEDVFRPLAEFIELQDQRLRLIGFSLGPFNLARLMFRWWAQGGAVRGVTVVAKKRMNHEMRSYGKPRALSSREILA